MRRLPLVALFCCVAAGTAQAQSAVDPGAAQAAGLFVQACVQYAGATDALRAFMGQLNVPAMPSDVAAKLLPPNQSGIAFNASNEQANLMVVSHDNGLCTVFSDSADGDQAAAAVVEKLTAAKVTLETVKDEADARNPALWHRNYRASLEQRKWALVLSSSKDAGRMHVIFTAVPRS